MNTLAVAGLLLGLVALLGGQLLEGGDLLIFLNAPAIVIVIGGTLGAAMLQTSQPVFVRAFRMLPWVWKPPKRDIPAIIHRIDYWGNLVRREGLLGLEGFIDLERDNFVKSGLQLVVDGTEPDTIRSMLELELELREQESLRAANVFSSMAGYSPTMGIIGAVLGLIQVMQNLSDPSQLGTGIATAFIATIYGVGLANLFFLPVANRLKSIVAEESAAKEAYIEGLVGIANGDNPRYIETKLKSYL